MPKKVYLDESGDLGWKFDAPYRKGGSSRYLTIAYAIIPQDKNILINRFVKDIYYRFNIPFSKELKATHMSIDQKLIVASKTIDFLNKNTDFLLGAITVSKERVMTHIRTDANKLYNYMIGQSILPKICNSPSVSLVRDNRTIKVQSGNSCIDYLQTKLWFEYSSPTLLKDLPTDSHTNKCLIFIDWMTNFVWSYYEDKSSKPFEMLSRKLINQTLFF